MKTKDIKAKARFLLNGHHARLASIVLTYLLLLLICQMIPTLIFTDITKPFALVSSLIVTYLVAVVTDLIAIGIMRICLIICRGGTYTFGDLFYAFRNHSDQFVKIRLILTGISTVLSLPSILINLISLKFDLNIYQYYGLIVLCAILSTVLSLLITLRFKMAEFIIMDNPEYGALGALKQSLQITKGQYFRLLGFYIRFIGMYFLSLLSVMIGYILVYPYIQTSLALLYEELK